MKRLFTSRNPHRKLKKSRTWRGSVKPRLPGRCVRGHKWEEYRGPFLQVASGDLENNGRRNAKRGKKKRRKSRLVAAAAFSQRSGRSSKPASCERGGSTEERVKSSKGGNTSVQVFVGVGEGKRRTRRECHFFGRVSRMNR